MLTITPPSPKAEHGHPTTFRRLVCMVDRQDAAGPRRLRVADAGTNVCRVATPVEDVPAMIYSAIGLSAPLRRMGACVRPAKAPMLRVAAQRPPRSEGARQSHVGTTQPTDSGHHEFPSGNIRGEAGARGPAPERGIARRAPVRADRMH